MMDLSSLQTSPRDLLFILFKWRWSVIAILTASLFSVLFWMMFIREETYEASAKILVKIGHEQSNTSAVAGPPILITGERMQDVNSEVDILRSTDLLTALMDHFHLDQPSPPKPPPAKLVARVRYEVRKVVRTVRELKDAVLIKVGFKEQLSRREATLAELRRRVLVTPERNSNVITVKLLVEQRQDSSILLNKLLDLYITFRLKIYSDRATEEFFRREVDTRSTTLAASEQELRAFEEKWNISAIEKQKEVLLNQIAEAQTAYTESEIQLREATDRVRRVQDLLKSEDPDVAAIGDFPANSFPSSLQAQLASLQREREHLRMTELDSGIRIRNNRKQFRVLVEMVANQLQSAQTERQAVRDTRRATLASLENTLHELKDRETGWSAAKRKVKVAEDSFLSFRKRMEESAAATSLERQNIGSVAVLEHAVDPVVPVGMSKVRLLGLSLLLSIFAAVAWISTAEFMDHRIYTAEDLEKQLTSPVLELVPAIKRRKLLRSSPAALASGDAYRRTAWSLAKPSSGPVPVVIFTGAARGEGATTALLAVAQHLTNEYRLRTLVLELDRAHPAYLHQLNLNSEQTLDAYLSGKLAAQACIQQHPSGVSFLPALTASDARVLDPSQLRRLLDEVRPGFDVILADGPPVLSPDVLPILSVIKHAVLVVESGRTRYETLDRAKRQLESEAVAIVGTILNKHRRFVPGWVYRWLLE